ncbi:MAG: hypothetical protein HZB82_05645 [Deltaproteobacteria bacterium]|nr:hypothetical protein [Deltaproteobacteria bacterium]
MAHGGHDDTHGHDTHGGGHGHGKDTQGAEATVIPLRPPLERGEVYSPSDEARRRWWSMPFDATTNFSLLGYFLGWIMDRNNKRVDMQLK